MDRNEVLRGTDVEQLYHQIQSLHDRLDERFVEGLERSLPFADEMFDRWERARRLGFGEGSSIYDSALVFGRPSVGASVWVGPNTIIDGSGGLEIGAHCTIAVGVQIYTHDNVRQTLTGGVAPIERSPVRIGTCTYLGPNTIIRRGVEIGDHCVIGANSYVGRSLPSHSIAAGSPARVIGRVELDETGVRFNYDAPGGGAAER